MYSVVSFHKILPEHLDDYIENMRVCAAATHKEPGCIRYEVMQDESDPTLMCLLQVFRDEKAYEAHQAAPHHVHWIELSGGWRDRSVQQRHLMQFIAGDPTAGS